MKMYKEGKKEFFTIFSVMIFLEYNVTYYKLKKNDVIMLILLGYGM